MTSAAAPPLRQRADLLFGLGWIVLGAAIAAGSWRMDRLEGQGVEPYAVPGLVPGLLGILLALLGLAMALRARRGPAAGTEAARAEPWRAALALVLVAGFVLGLLGRGPPFWLAAFIFMFLAILLFEWPDRRRAGTLARGAVQAVLIAAAASAIITLVFQEVFLVRLP
ncbi:MAG: tripartite tricarboxylate transporter TctB family protein [Acetobacteraceae bacterium]|nr:tripartite tricarboxylate transporter TctB family protein [Acetobacteraceae bacterium]